MVTMPMTTARIREKKMMMSEAEEEEAGQDDDSALGLYILLRLEGKKKDITQ